MRTMKIGPKNEREKLIFCAEALRVDVQHAIHSAMRESKITQRELARRLDVTEARVSQIFASNSNPTLAMMARIFHATGHVCKLNAVRDDSIRPAEDDAGWVLTPKRSDYKRASAEHGQPPPGKLAA